MNEEIPLCKCGCGKFVSKIGCVWCRGHHTRLEEIKNKISLTNKGRPTSELQKRRVSEVHTGKKLSDETKKLLSIANTGRIKTIEERKKLSRAMIGHAPWCLGRKHSEQTKELMSISHQNNPRVGYTHSEETRKKLSESLKGREPGHTTTHSEETKKKISEKMTGRPGYWKDKKIPKEMLIKRSITKRKNGTNIPWNKDKKNCYRRESLRKMRLSHFERLKKLFPDGTVVRPNIGDKEFPFLDLLKQNIQLHIKIQEPVDGYFLDFYIPEINLAIEFDEHDGHTSEAHILHDKNRELDIKEILGCEFYRIKEIDWDTNQERVIIDVKNFIEQKLKEIPNVDMVSHNADSERIIILPISDT